MVSGEINRIDGRSDLAVGIVDDDGPAVLVFEGRPGALQVEPERIALDAPAAAFSQGLQYRREVLRGSSITR